MIAFTRPVAQSIANCELTHLERAPIDVIRATRQHAAYEQALRSLWCDVRRLPELPEHPDSVFIEDTAVVLDECAIVTRPGAESRRGEVAGVEEALRPFRRLYHIEAPGRLDGGDVLRVGRRLYVGISTRSNEDGARQLADAVASHGYTVKRVAVRECLHLKSAVSTLPDDALVLNPPCVDPESFDGARFLCVHPDESEAANVLMVGKTIVVPLGASRTRQMLEDAGYAVVEVDASELAKAEGGLTCCSLIVTDAATRRGDTPDSSPGAPPPT
ncbi:MAG: dimethylarginine dimethylaminohydrolase family protein [Gemmatimonadaceae bacterium]